MAVNQNVTQLTQQTGSANLTSLFYAVTGGANDTGLPLSVLFNSPTFTGTVTVPTPTTADNTTKAASTAYVQSNLVSYLTITTAASTYAPINSPTFTGTPLTPTASAGTNTTQIASTAFVTNIFAAPPSLGATTPANVSATTLSASSTVSGVGFSTYLASPPPIGGTAANTGKFTTLQATSTITPSTTSGIVGTTLADNANAGSVGEYTTNTTSGTSLLNSTTVAATSVSLTAGDWDITGVVQFVPAGTTVLSNEASGISTSSTVFGALGTYQQLIKTNSAGNGDLLAAPVVRMNLSSTTTIYLLALAGVATSTCTVSGFIRARRVR